MIFFDHNWCWYCSWANQPILQSKQKKDWRSRKENIEHSVQFDFTCSKWLDVMHGNRNACEDLALQKCSRTIILVILMDNYTKIHHVKNKVHKCYEWFAVYSILFRKLLEP